MELFIQLLRHKRQSIRAYSLNSVNGRSENIIPIMNKEYIPFTEYINVRRSMEKLCMYTHTGLVLNYVDQNLSWTL